MLAPRFEAVVVQLLACLVFFCSRAEEPLASALAGVRVELVAHTQGTSAVVSRAARAFVAHHQDAPPTNDLSAAEPESAETDAVPEALTFRVHPRIAPIARLAPSAQHIVRAAGWRPQPIPLLAMAQGPP
jgi:hypothetical protein